MATTRHYTQDSRSSVQRHHSLAAKLIDATVHHDDDEKGFEEVDRHEAASRNNKQVAVKASDDHKEQADEASELKASEMVQLNALSEDELVRSERFASALDSAIEHITNIAKAHRVEMVDAAKTSFQRETGAEATEEMVVDALKQFATNNEEEADEDDDEESIDEEHLAQEMEQALDTVRALGRAHQATLVNTVCDQYAAQNDNEEMSFEALSSLFGGIRSDLAAEVAAEKDESADDELADGELESALDLCRALGSAHQPALIDSIRFRVRDIRGAEPSTEDISGILARIKAEFAAEARDEFLEDHDRDDEEDAADSDYQPEADRNTFLWHRDRSDDAYYSDATSDDTGNVGDMIDAEFSPQLDTCDYSAEELGHGDLDDEHEADSDSGVDQDQQSHQSYATDLVDQAIVDEQVDSEAEAAEERREAEFALSQMDSALEHVRELGAGHQVALVDAVSAIYCWHFGEAPSTAELRNMFSAVKDRLAEEAQDDEASSDDVSESVSQSIRSNDSETEQESEQDDSYDVEQDSFDYAVDAADDLDSEFQDEETEAESEDYSERDSYRPSDDSFDYALDAEDSLEYELSVSDSAAESGTESVDDSVSSATKQTAAVTIQRAWHAYQHRKYAMSEEFSERESYDPGEDSFDYALDAEDDVGSTSDVDLSSAAQSENESEAETIVLFDEAFVVRGFSIFKDRPTEQSEAESEATGSEFTEQSESVFSESVAESDGVSELATEMGAALEHVRNLAKQHQETLVHSICERLRDHNDGAEPSTSQLLGVFRDIKQGFIDNDCTDTQEDSEDASEASDYDPDDDSFDYCLDIEDDFDLCTDTDTDAESAVEAEVDEAELINSEHFAEEWHSAIEHVEQLASEHQKQILVRTALANSEATADELADALGAFAVAPRERDSDGELASEMESALEHVRDLGRLHQPLLAANLMDLFRQHNGEHPTAEDLSGMFAHIVDAFAEEAQEDTDDESDLAEQLESAIEHVRELGTQRQPALVNRICEIYAELSGQEATAQDLSSILADVKESLANEEKEDFLVDTFARQSAAVKIQRAWSTYQRKKKAAIKIQRAWSAYQRRKDDASESEDESEDDSADTTESEATSFTEYGESESDTERESEGSKDSEYDPDRDTFDYCRDIEEDHLASSSDEFTEDSESA